MGKCYSSLGNKTHPEAEPKNQPVQLMQVLSQEEQLVLKLVLECVSIRKLTALRLAARHLLRRITRRRICPTTKQKLLHLSFQKIPCSLIKQI